MGWVGVSSVWATSVAFYEMWLGRLGKIFKEHEYLISLVGSSCGNLALLAGCKLSQVAMVITLPVRVTHTSQSYEMPDQIDI